MKYMGLDRLLNIYQAYTITKISAYNKQMLIAHYAQCEKIGELQQQIKVANSVSRNILKNQLKEIELREEQKFYKGLAFNMNEVYEKISSITDTNLQTFYSNLLLSKILENLKECQDNLDEINDKEYCKKLQNKCNAFLNNITRRTQHTDSPLNKLLIFEQDYKNKVAERRILLRNKKSELAQYKKRLDTIHKKDILSKKLKKGFTLGCIILLCLTFLPGIIAQISNISTKQVSLIDFSILLAIFLIPLFLLLRYYQKINSSETPLKNQQEINQLTHNITKTENELNYIENDNSLETHTFIIAKKIVETEYPNLEKDLSSILRFFLIKESQKDLYDDLLRRSAELIVNNRQASVALLQRTFSIGYNRANKIMEQLASIGIVEDIDDKHREVLIHDKNELDEIFKQL